ncbi:hypothetical protein GCM10010358_69960 [Streptomyces minutiscleroticus]|uniref:N-acetyltransferase domain-containing protein n=1 Tax=Streptomyces minutiscleroticus TaxID=68238 RepID=A0A918NYB9_9ACTN|nr:GNAT family N-acetyltransferase [Streptomyces minutiscleroticus]GGY06725.1 hypothetical protein GCM10010358_69960 [Streptomyces minutiscleroticus]
MTTVDDMGYEFRTARPEDKVAVTENGFALQEIPVDPPIHKVFPAENTDDSDAPAVERETNSRTFVAVGTDGILAGFATVSYASWNRRLAIEDIEIAPAHRGRGVGRALIGHAAELAGESGDALRRHTLIGRTSPLHEHALPLSSLLTADGEGPYVVRRDRHPLGKRDREGGELSDAEPTVTVLRPAVHDLQPGGGKDSQADLALDRITGAVLQLVAVGVLDVRIPYLLVDDHAEAPERRSAQTPPAPRTDGHSLGCRQTNCCGDLQRLQQHWTF